MNGRKLVAEGLGTAFLLITVVGSGVMGERLAGGNLAVALLANSLATGAALVTLILTFGPISGAHFNPLVTLMMAAQRTFPWHEVFGYIFVQIIGAFVGVAIANLIFDQPAFFISQHRREGLPLLGSEVVATFGLLATIWNCSRYRPAMAPFAIGAYITAAYWFTSSTSFANPAVTLARMLTDTFAGIGPQDVPGFIVAQLIGALGAVALFRWFVPMTTPEQEK